MLDTANKWGTNFQCILVGTGCADKDAIIAHQIYDIQSHSGG